MKNTNESKVKIRRNQKQRKQLRLMNEVNK